MKKNGETNYRVRVQMRINRFPNLRLSSSASQIKSFLEAEKVEAKISRDLERQILEEESRRTIIGQTWRYVLNHWYESQLNISVPFGSVSKTSVDECYSGMRRWMNRSDSTPCADISALDLMNLFNQISEAGLSLGHRKKLRTKLKAVFDHGVHAGLIRLMRNPMHDLILKRVDEKKPEILSLGEIRKLVQLALIHRHEWRHIWVLALLTGMRNGELFALKWSDTDFDQKMITVARAYNMRTRSISSTKAGYWRYIPMSPDCVRVLNELQPITGGAEFVLPRLSRWDHGIQASVLRTFCLENGLPSIRFHALRACFGTQLLRQGVPAAVVMKIAGWKDLKTMQRYIRLAGVEVAGATEKLSVLPVEEIADNVVSFRR